MILIILIMIIVNCNYPKLHLLIPSDLVADSEDDDDDEVHGQAT